MTSLKTTIAIASSINVLNVSETPFASIAGLDRGSVVVRRDGFSDRKAVVLGWKAGRFGTSMVVVCDDAEEGECALATLEMGSYHAPGETGIGWALA